jgi:acetyl esterase
LKLFLETYFTPTVDRSAREGAESGKVGIFQLFKIKHMRPFALKIFVHGLLFLLPAILCAQHVPFTTDGYDSYMPETRQMNKYLSSVYPHLDINKPAGLKTLRAVWGQAGGKPTLKVQDLYIPGSGGKIRIRVFKPDSVKAVVLDIHGGGFIAGRPENNDSLNDAIARICKVAVVSIDYRLAPENPFSAEVEDCDTVAAWLLQHGKTEFGSDKLLLTGLSAGANLAAHVLFFIRDNRNAIDRVLGVNFFYGGFDLSGSPSARMVTSHTLILDSTILFEIQDAAFKGKSREEMRSPEYSPMFANLKGLPPALFSVGTLDPLFDDNVFMADRWESAGNKTTLYVYPECTHAFSLFPTQIGKLANQRVIDWISGLLK